MGLRKAYLCGSPNHIMSAINQSYLNADGTNTVVILNFFRDAERLATGVEALPFVHYVAYKRATASGITGAASQAIEAFFTPAEIRDAFEKQAYDEIICFAHDHTTFAKIIDLQRQINPACKFYYGDSGTVSYMKDVEASDALSSTLMTLTNTAQHLQYVDGVKLYSPCLLINPRTNLPVFELEPIDIDNEELVNVYRGLWSYNAGDVSSVDAIYLQQPFYEREEIAIQGAEDRILDMLENAFQGKRLYTKMHPRSVDLGDEYPNPLVFSGPSEAIIMNILCECSPVFIGIDSSSLVTPMSLLDRYPHLIVLYRLAFSSNDPRYDELEQFFAAVEGAYHERGARIDIPRTLTEFEAVLESLNPRPAS